MKKRIAAMLLAAVMVFNIGGEACRPKAVAPAVAAAIPGLVFNLYAVLTGRWDDCAEALGYVLEEGVEGMQKAFVGTEDTLSWFVTGWCQITNTVESWFDDGTIELDENGKVYMNYYNYLQLCDIMYEYVDITLDLGSGLEHGIVNTPFNTAVLCEYMPIFDCAYEEGNRCTYAPMYYDDTCAYVGYYNIRYFNWLNDDGTSQLSSVALCYNTGGAIVQCSGDFETYIPSYVYDSAANSLCFNWLKGGTTANAYPVTVDTWYKLDSVTGAVTSCDFSEVDTTLSQGYLICEGVLSEFMKTVSGISAVPDTSQIEDLSEPLDELLVLNPDPGLVVDTDPSIAVPTDAILITDVPAVDEMTLTEALENTAPRLDMEVPSSIWNKFPFSLPFDFYRLLTIFAAEPKAPIFTIPISNVNVDMSAFEGNQTLGQFASGETTELLFEIDEEIVIDLSNIPYIQPISYTVFIVSFIALLIFVTTKLIHH